MTEDEAASLVGECFPQLRGAVARRLATGWDNTVMRVGDDWLFRFPRREVAVPGVAREIAVLPRLAPRLPLPIPVPELIAADGMETFPWPFWGARLVPGRELAESGLGEAERVEAARGIGAFLRALHDPALVAEVGADLPYDRCGGGSLQCARPWLWNGWTGSPRPACGSAIPPSSVS